MLRSGREPTDVARKLAIPPTTVKAWARARELAAAGSQHTRKEVVDRTIKEFATLDALVRRLSPRDLATPMGFSPAARDRWTVKDALAHVTFWKADIGRKALAVRRSAEERAAMRVDPNHYIYLRWRRRSAKDVVAWHRRVHKELLAALNTAPETWFSKHKPSSGWPYDVDRHLAQHRQDIEKALAARITPSTDRPQSAQRERRP